MTIYIYTYRERYIHRIYTYIYIYINGSHLASTRGVQIGDYIKQKSAKIMTLKVEYGAFLASPGIDVDLCNQSWTGVSIDKYLNDKYICLPGISGFVI